MAEFRTSHEVEGITLIISDQLRRVVAYIDDEKEILHYYCNTSNSLRKDIQNYLKNNSISYKTKNREN